MFVISSDYFIICICLCVTRCLLFITQSYTEKQSGNIPYKHKPKLFIIFVNV
jgi:hypothetical protein